MFDEPITIDVVGKLDSSSSVRLRKDMLGDLEPLSLFELELKMSWCWLLKVGGDSRRKNPLVGSSNSISKAEMKQKKGLLICL